MQPKSETNRQKCGAAAVSHIVNNSCSTAVDSLFLDYETELFSELTKAARDAIIVIDNSGKITFWNDTSKDIFGYSQAEVLGKNIHDLLCPEKYMAQHKTAFDNFTKTGEGWAVGKIVELEGVTKSGREIPIELSLTAVKLKNGCWNALGIIRDNSERKNAERLIRRKLAIEETISSVSSMFVSPANLDSAINDALAKLGSLCDASRTYLFQYYDNAILMSNTHEWCAKGVNPQKENLQELPDDMFPWWTQKIKNGDIILVPNIDDLPQEAAAEKEILEMQAVKSLIVFPIVIEGEISGFIGMDNVESIGGWSGDDISTLHTIANIISKGLEAKKTELELKQRIDFERLITNISADFVEVSIEGIDSAIEKAMGSIGNFTDSDRAYVFLFSKDKVHVNNTHEWCAEGIEPEIQNLQDIHLSEELPFFDKKMCNHEIFYSYDVAALPPTAGLECKHFENQGIKSLVVVPMFQEKQITGFLGFDSVKSHRKWTENEQALLQLVGESITHLLKRKESEKAIMAQAHMLDSITQAVITTDPLGRIEYMNKAAEKIYDRKFKDVKGLDIAQVMRAEITPEQTDEIMQSLKETSILGGEIKVHRRDGNEFIANVDETPVFTEKGDLSGIMFISYDITGRKKAERALLHSKLMAEEANRTKSEFLANMSHELRTPLNSIIGFSEILLLNKNGELNDKQIRYTKNIVTSGKHLLELINDILDISKVESGNMEFEPENINLVETIDEVVTLIGPMAKRKFIELRCGIEPDSFEIYADRLKVKQIMYNLLSNAIKFTPEKGKVCIKSKIIDDILQISVSDTGIGISKEDYDTIFDPFKQMDSFLTRQFSGTGLGLALVKKYVEMHGGNIWLESEVGKGTTFTFTLSVSKSYS